MGCGEVKENGGPFSWIKQPTVGLRRKHKALPPPMILCTFFYTHPSLIMYQQSKVDIVILEEEGLKHFKVAQENLKNNKNGL